MQSSEFKEVSLSIFGRGAAVEMFDTELKKVLENIMDPNTKATGVRKVTLEVLIKPDNTREKFMVGITCKSKIEMPNPYGTRFLSDRVKIG